MSFAYIWEYRVRPDSRAGFLAAYAADGEWARLFASDPAYFETRLLQDRNDDDRYLTVDFWRSQADRDNFVSCHAEAFEALDRRCESYTRAETSLGDFTLVLPNDAT